MKTSDRKTPAIIADNLTEAKPAIAQAKPARACAATAPAR